ncbi:uncharacterized protein si:rp71-77l1.2 isoform X1 [Danio rerio]|uniref:Uncharacterized protein si:rp71-77l1.2 isoform X1 n=1 Tax=Danio rerio TaxID=7955 RepID=A0AC58HLF6_DANRE
MDPRLNSPEKSQFPPPPSYQDSPPPYTPSYPGQSVPQAPYVQGPHPRQAVVSVQPAVFVAAAPLQTPPPDYLCYSIFNLFCCCFPLGIAALIFSVSALPSRGFTKNGRKKRKYPVSDSSVGTNALLMPELRGEWPDWFQLIERQQ